MYLRRIGLYRLAQHGVECQRVILVGGGSKSPLWRRVAADTFQRPLIFPIEPESAALGAALQAAAVRAQTDIVQFVFKNAPHMEEGELEPDASTAQMYADGLARHNTLGNALFSSSTSCI